MRSESLKVLFMLILTYVVLYVLSNFISPLLGGVFPMKALEFKTDLSRLDYMLWLVPVSAFFFIYLLIPFMRTELGFGKNFIYAFPLIFFIASYLAYFVAIYWFYDNQAVLSGLKLSDFNLDFLNLFSIAYWRHFIGSHFFYFVFASLAGCVARLVLENFEDLTSK